MQNKTPLRKWLKAHGESVSSLARALDVSRGRAQFWVQGATMPRGPLLEELLVFTGLTLKELLPSLSIQRKRRFKERKRRLSLLSEPVRIIKTRGKNKKIIEIHRGEPQRIVIVRKVNDRGRAINRS